MDVIVLLGRIVFSFVFISSGVNHIVKRQMFAGYAGHKGVPVPMVSVLASGALILLGGISVLLGIWADLGSLFLVAFCFPTALLMHAFWKETDPQSRAMEVIQFTKDTALGGASLMLFAFFAYAGDDLGLTLTGPLFNLR
jgi:putative oxidoreductase